MARRILPTILIPGLLAAAISSSFAADPVKIRVASVSVPPSMHTLYMQVAYEEGIYRRNGLEVDDILQMNSGPLVTQALAAGHVDVADTDAEGVLNAAAAGFKLVAVFPVIINAQIGVMNVSPAFIETARAFGCNRWQTFRRVVLYAAVPFFIAGIRLGLGRALVGVVVAEMFTALSGLGHMVVFYGNTFRTAELFVPIVVLAVLSIAITHLIVRFERWVAPWRVVGE